MGDFDDYLDDDYVEPAPVMPDDHVEKVRRLLAAEPDGALLADMLGVG